MLLRRLPSFPERRPHCPPPRRHPPKPRRCDASRPRPRHEAQSSSGAGRARSPSRKTTAERRPLWSSKSRPWASRGPSATPRVARTASRFEAKARPALPFGAASTSRTRKGPSSSRTTSSTSTNEAQGRSRTSNGCPRTSTLGGSGCPFRCRAAPSSPWNRGPRKSGRRSSGRPRCFTARSPNWSRRARGRTQALADGIGCS